MTPGCGRERERLFVSVCSPCDDLPGDYPPTPLLKAAGRGSRRWMDRYQTHILLLAQQLPLQRATHLPGCSVPPLR